MKASLIRQYECNGHKQILANQFEVHSKYVESVFSALCISIFLLEMLLTHHCILFDFCETIHVISKFPIYLCALLCPSTNSYEF